MWRMRRYFGELGMDLIGWSGGADEAAPTELVKVFRIRFYK